ncbi:hypothetical protein GCM10015535_09980 [Streptomyces gelaticus]|uniref:Uncharacterized protein n=1 Tax=Streptomyces gelaticus TaxID=285446 RepID=A0ABQ2VUX1_9ACTN|nr:hypothetical protein GCM10015535_09980 [Streptomyces gelaticus]
MALRGTGAVCALASAVLHLMLVPSHLTEMPYIGVLFLIGSVVLLAVAAGLLLHQRPFGAWLIGAVTSIGMIAGFLLSRTVGLPDYRETSWEPPYGVLCLIAEVVFVLAFLAWLRADGTDEGTGISRERQSNKRPDTYSVQKPLRREAHGDLQASDPRRTP